MDQPSGIQRFLAEAKRRHVFRIICAYAAASFVVMEVANNFFPALNLPHWTTTLVAALCILGLPIALVLSWTFDLTLQGVKRTEPLAGEAGAPLRVRSFGYGAVGLVLILAGFGVYTTVGRDWSGAEGRIDALAVLPFTNLSGDPDNEYFSDGITEDILSQLSGVGALRVISRTSVMQYKRTTKSLREIGQELGVSAIVEGSVRRTGDRVRITAKLIDARSDKQLWTETYDREVTDILAVQSDIGRRIAAKLDARLSAIERERFAAGEERIIDPRAYEAYLRGIYHSDEGRQEQAIRAFEEALAIEPTFAPAYAGLARNYYFLGFYGLLRPDIAFDRLKDAAEKALKHDDRLADAHGSLALYAAHREGDWVAAERHFREALDLGPNRAQVHHDYAHFLLARGRLDESAEQSRIAANLDPANSMLTACAGWHGFTAGQYDVAVDRSLKALMMMPDMFWPELILGWAYEQTGRLPEAIGAFHKAVAHSQESSVALSALGHALAKAGRTTEAKAVLAKLESLREKRYVSSYDIATVYAGLGETEEALEWLREAWDEKAGFAIHIGWDPRFAKLHGNTRFAALLESAELPLQRIAAAVSTPSVGRGGSTM